MKTSIFSKYFASSAVIILISLALLTVIATIFESHYWKQQQLHLLSNGVDIIVASVADDVDDGDYKTQLFMRGNKLASSGNITVFYVDINGDTILCCSNNSERRAQHVSKRLPSKVFKEAFNDGSYSHMGTLGGFYDSDNIVCGRTLILNDTAVGVLFASSEADSLWSYISQIFFVFLISACIALIIQFMISFAITRSTLRPLKEMADAAQAMANGDFSKQIVYSENNEIGDLARAFNDMSSSLKSLEYMSSSFIANVSHEFKTPMTTIGGFIDGILDGTIKEEDQRAYLTIVSDEVKRLSTMVTSMLTLSKLESGITQLSFTNNDITELICNAIIYFEHKITDKKIDVYGMEDFNPILIECDADMLYHVFFNLVDNAVKFTPSGGYISFSNSQRDDMVEIYIKNNGIGLTDDEIKHVFERFYKTDKSRSMDKKGTGLGLYLVKKIVEYHNGTVSARSDGNMYTEFCISLPRHQ